MILTSKYFYRFEKQKYLIFKSGIILSFTNLYKIYPKQNILILRLYIQLCLLTHKRIFKIVLCRFMGISGRIIK